MAIWQGKILQAATGATPPSDDDEWVPAGATPIDDDEWVPQGATPIQEAKKSVRSTVFPDDVYDPTRDSLEAKMLRENFAKAGITEMPHEQEAGPLLTGIAQFANTRLFGLPNKYKALGDAVEALATPGKDARKTFRMRSDYYDNLLAEELANNPKSGFLASLLGVMGGAKDINKVTGLGKAGLDAAGKRAPGMLALGKRLGAAGAGAGLQGGTTAAVENVADLAEGDVGEYAGKIAHRGLTDAALGIGGQAVLGEAVPSAFNFLARGVVKPSGAGEELIKRGAKDLTIGQMSPGSTLAQLEEAATSSSVGGKIIEAQRQAGKESWQRAVLNEARPPGMKPVGPGAIEDQMSAIYSGFEEAYAPIKAHAVPTTTRAGKTLRGAIAEAIDDPDVMADPDTTNAVRRFLVNQLDIIPRDGKVMAERLLKVRHEIRSAKSEARLMEKLDRAKLLERAEEAVTDVLEERLPTKAAEALRNTDMQYSRFKVVEDAAFRAAGQPGGVMTEAQLVAAVKKATGKPITRGAGGELYKLGKLARESTEAKSPITGARLLTMTPFSKWLYGPALAMANTQGGKRFLMGQTGAQRRALELAEAMRGRGVTSSAAGRLPFAITEGAADHEGRQLLPAWAYEGEMSPEEQRRALAQTMRGGR